ncbi:MAG: RsmD family RNA methyltransferase [Desulfobacterales bacterium]|nr:RsmD family RNA methyltransferase [Desulfobacterales bacterium]
MTYYFHAAQIRSLAAAQAVGKPVDISLDLNLTTTSVVVENNELILDTGERIPMDALLDVLRAENKVFIWQNGALSPVEVRANGYYKLVPTDSAPTLEIDGVKMHRSKDIDPLDDARIKTARVVTPGGRILDTCGGLGYSAIHCIKAGAGTVVSVEKNPSVLEIRSRNPWSHTPESRKVQWVHDDSTQYIHTLDDGAFNGVIHDPPRITSATGDLYGQAFYNELFRVMKTGGKLFHYTGTPQRIKHGDRFVTNAMKRLEKSGFNSVTFNDYLQGIEAVKAPFPW